ncbi:unnamed protein product [Leuciscus chuanchicus]
MPSPGTDYHWANQPALGGSTTPCSEWKRDRDTARQNSGATPRDERRHGTGAGAREDGTCCSEDE